MSTISSLYGSPKSSMMSRDPAGRDSRGAEDSVGLEPAGSRAEESFAGPVDPLSMSYSMGSSAVPRLDPMDLSRLVGAPPPPPKSPPPQKSRRRGGSGTPRSSDGRSFASSKFGDAHSAYSSFDDDSLMMYSTGSTTLSSIMQKLPAQEQAAPTYHTRNIIVPVQSEDSLKIDSPPHKAQVDKSSSIVEERVKAALATYESDELVLDTSEAAIENEVLRPAMGSRENKPEAVEEQQQTVEPVAVVSKPSVPSPRSPAMAAESHPEPANPVADDDGNDPSNMTVFTHISETSSEVPSENKKDDAPVQQPQTIEKEDAPVKQPQTISQTLSTGSKSSQKSTKKKEDKPKRGFFKKLFRGRNKKQTDSPESREAEAEVQAVEVAPEAPSMPANDAPADAPADEIQQDMSPAASPVAVKPVPVETEVEPEVSTETSNEQAEQDDTVPEAASAEKEEEVSSPAANSQSSGSVKQAFSMDPPDDAHGDSPVAAGRQVFEEYAENLRPDDEVSALPEIDTKTDTRDQDGYFFAQDDVGVISPGVDKPEVETESSDSEPKGMSPVNASTAAQDDGPETIDGPLPTPANASGLRVRVDGPSADPAGASPLKWDTSGKPTSQSAFSDPVGESPVHAWENNDKGAEEKKEEDENETKSELPFDERKLTVGLPRPKKDQSLKVDTDVEKAGFKSASSTPVAGGEKILNVAAAALTNAKAVAYLHRLEGEPSPRHTWHSSKRTAPSPLSVRAKRAVGKRYQKHSQAAAKKPSPDEYGAHNFDEKQLVSEEEEELKPPVEEKPLEELHAVKTKEGALFSAYNSKFQGRKPSKKKSLPPTPSGRRVSVGSDIGETMMKSRPPTPANGFLNFVDWSKIELMPGKISGLAVTKGIKLRRSKRDDDVANGRSARVVLTPKVKTEGRNRFNFFPADESEIKDPIQRAGRRLLSKSAIPIQCAARRYIARMEAVDRMWALIVIQSYFRRWRAETNLQAHAHSATNIQKAFRGWIARDKLKEMHYCAAQVQKIVRGYLVQAQVYDTMYYIVRLQAFMRGCYERKKHAEWVKLSNEKAIKMQAAYRSYRARQEYEVAVASAIVVQATWRSYSARINYQFEIVDIIIVQSIARRWAASRQVENLKNMELFGPASIIQAMWRGHEARKLHKKHLAALKIQTMWRRFQCYTDYIFALVDVLVVQRTARRWLAKQAARRIRKENAAVKIQSAWRKHQAQNSLIFSMVNIIIAQSVARRYLSKFAVQKRELELEAEGAEKERMSKAATAIQKTWRGFWGFSHFVIIQYEITRLQAMVRGRIGRQTFNLKLGCAIIIQATIRRHLAKRAIEKKVLADTMANASALKLRERNAAKKIQFWWRIVLDWTKEKKAALTIERFFIHVRAEVDREIMRRERKKMMKREKRRQKKRESDERMLEKVWLNTVDENNSLHQSRDTRSVSETRSNGSSRQRDMPSPRGQSPEHEEPHRTPALDAPIRAPSPRFSSGNSIQSNIGQEVDIDGYPIQRVDSTLSRGSRRPTEAVRVAASEDHSEVSNITNPSVFHRMNTGRFELPARQPRERKMSTEDYIKKYSSGADGNRTAPNRLTKGQPQHFFSDDGSVGSRKSRSSVSSSQRRASSGTPRSVPQGYNQVQSTTPRSSYGVPSFTPRTPRAHIQPVPSPRISVGFPPVTPKSLMKNGRQHIARRETAETESHTTTYSQTSFSKASPRSRPDGHVINHGSGSPVVVMKHYPNYARSDSIDAQEVMYLGRDEFGEEYGEV